MAASQAGHEDCPSAELSHETETGLAMVTKFFWHARTEVTLRGLTIIISQDTAVRWAMAEHTILDQVVAWAVDQTGDWRKGDPRTVCWVHSRGQNSTGVSDGRQVERREVLRMRRAREDQCHITLQVFESGGWRWPIWSRRALHSEHRWNLVETFICRDLRCR
jgi:hypothetical protein